MVYVTSTHRRFFHVLPPPLRPWKLDDGWGDSDPSAKSIAYHHIYGDADYPFDIVHYDSVLGSFINPLLPHINFNNDVPPPPDDDSGDEYTDDDMLMDVPQESISFTDKIKSAVKAVVNNLFKLASTPHF